MPVFDFPSAPSIGQVFADTASGAEYEWEGEKWRRTKVAIIPPPTPPILTGLVPSEVLVGDTSPATIRCVGSNFFADSVIQIDGTAVATTFVSTTELTFRYTIPAAAGTVQVT